MMCFDFSGAAGAMNSRNNFDEWLKDALEQRFGPIVHDKVLSLGTLDPGTFDALSEELAQVTHRCRDMSDFRHDIVNQDGHALTLEWKVHPFPNIPLSEKRERTVGSQCSSANMSPRNERSQDSYTPSDKRGRSANRSTAQRMQALEVLLKVPVGDIVSSANWPQLQQELCESLRDDNWIIFMQVLKVLARLSSSVTFSPVREGLLSLLEGLTLYYLTRHLHQQLPTALHGVQLNNSVHRRIILIAHSLLHSFNQIPGKWIRYGEKRSQELVDNFVDILSMHTHHHRALHVDQSKDILYPFHIFSILDPKAKWCVGVMHAAFGRNIFLKSVMKSTSLIRFIVEEVMIWLSCQMKFTEGVTTIFEAGENGNVNGNLITLTVFIQCVSLLQLFIDSERGHMMFPVLTSIQEEPVSVYSLLLKILGFLNKVSNEQKRNHSDKLLKILENVCSSLILSRGTRILHGSSVELIHLLLEVPNGMDNLSLHPHNIGILCKISESPLAVKWMLGRPARRTREGITRAFSDLRISLSSASSSGRESTLSNRTACIARRIAKTTTAALQDRNRFTAMEAASPVCQYLFLSDILFSSPEGYLILESCEGHLVPLAGHLFMHIRNLMYNSDLELLCIQRSLESFLIGVALTPMGFLAVSNVEDLVKSLVSAHVEKPSTTKCPDPRILHLLQLSASKTDIKLQTQRRSLVKHALTRLWAAYDTKSEFVWQEAKQNFMTVVLSICASPTVFSEMLDDLDMEDSSSESTLVEEIEPLSLKELLARGLQSTHDLDHLREISLHLLHSLSHNIDFGSPLQEKLRLTEHLQRMIFDRKLKELCHELTIQPSPRKDKTISVIDENARCCYHIITIMNQLRDSSSCDSPSASSRSPRSPRSPRTHAHTSRPRPRVLTELQRFLQDTRQGLHDSMWMSHARRVYRVSCRTEIKVPMLLDLLDQVLQSQSVPTLPEVNSRWQSCENASPSQQYFRAIDKVVRYGCQIKALNVNMISQHTEQLSLLLHQAQSFLNNQNPNNYFDWFTASVFLMCAGNVDRCRSVLQRVAILPAGSFIWPLLSQNTLQLTASINHQMQCLLSEYVPKAYNVLLETGVPWWLITERLTHQAFLPTLPLSQLSHLIAFAALHSWEYNLYLRIAILAHIQPSLLEMSLEIPILSFLLELRMDNFLIADYVPFMDKLAKLNRPTLGRDRIATATL